MFRKDTCAIIFQDASIGLWLYRLKSDGIIQFSAECQYELPLDSTAHGNEWIAELLSGKYRKPELSSGCPEAEEYFCRGAGRWMKKISVPGGRTAISRSEAGEDFRSGSGTAEEKISVPKRDGG